MVVDSDMDGFCTFSGNLFAVLTYYLKVGDVCLGMVVGNVMFVNYTSDMIVFFYSIF